MYRELAPWFHLLTPPHEYAEEAASALALMREHADGPIATLLELGSGGGNMASHLKRDAELTLTGLSPDMLDLGRTINPECEHIPGDMRSLRLGRTFDAVLAHDAICYMATEADLRAGAVSNWPRPYRPGSCSSPLKDDLAHAEQRRVNG
jgi:SAM-dependent methyltransferase